VWHRSVLVGSQAMHALPLGPHLSGACGMHRLPWQQPAGHDVASQAHTPFMQRWPSPHGDPPPHRQAPVIEQPSALPASQPMQAAPAAPQAATDRE
jgi:hypothetical protein